MPTSGPVGYKAQSSQGPARPNPEFGHKDRKTLARPIAEKENGHR